MNRVELTKGYFALIDDEDYERVSQWRWKYHKNGYAVRTLSGGAQQYMHRFINKTPRGVLTDHINRNGLDNQKSNLRNVNYSQNAFNTGLYKHNTSGIKGVQWNKQKGRWQACIQVNRKLIHLGFYTDIHEAELARKQGEKNYV